MGIARKFLRGVFPLLLAAALALGAALPAGAEFNSLLREVPGLTGKSEILLLLSQDDGSVIFSQNEHLQTAPASLTKLATAILVLENCADVEAPVTIRREIFDTYDAANSSNAGLLAGETVSVKDLLYCLLIPSANEAAQALADYIGGQNQTDGTAKENVARFIAMMNEFAARVGLENTQFKNAHGLDEPGHYTTAADVAKILQYALHPDFAGNRLFEAICATREYRLPATNKHPARNVYSTNHMINPARKEYYVKGCTGIKTGHTSQAGQCLTSKAARDGLTYICIVMRGQIAPLEKGGIDYNTAIYDSKCLLEWCFKYIRYRRVVAQDTIVGELPVALARDTDHVQLVPKASLSALVPEGVGSGSVLVELLPETLAQALVAPVKEGAALGQARVLYAGQEFARIELVAAEGVQRSASLYLFSLAKRALGNKITHLLLLAILLVASVYLAALLLRARKKRQEKRLRVVAAPKK
ncbi:MAG: serine hydrolase [Oscillospiraceae bacterium]|jgi:D-alanyl-D-alanine carboxypeptidase (penicillin-binding protein 5/6)|nr:serine hydrolase [Oscillospiraceae bacterium]